MEPARNIRSNVFFHDAQPATVDARSALLAGLHARQKTVEPKWFYDAEGSALFEQITRLPEYYPTRTELAILNTHARAIGEHCGPDCVLIEPGAGSCEKARLLLPHLQPAAYVPMDISAQFLQESALQLGQECPWLNIYAVCADFNTDWTVPEGLPAGKRVVFYPGSTIGNLEPTAARDFLSRVRQVTGAGGGMIVGVDLHKSSERLNAAYNDVAGVTAEFNLNILHRLNEVLDADFKPAQFSHHAFYNTDARRIEMHLVSDKNQRVNANGGDIEFAAGESIHTENSYKYTVESFTELAASAGLQVQQCWQDEEQLFSVFYLAT